MGAQLDLYLLIIFSINVNAEPNHFVRYIKLNS